jgi:hypothetical protein
MEVKETVSIKKGKQNATLSFGILLLSSLAYLISAFSNSLVAVFLQDKSNAIKYFFYIFSIIFIIAIIVLSVKIYEFEIN